MSIPQQLFEHLIATSLESRKNAYAPYSGFQVGSAVLGVNDKIYGGCNVENASYGLTICAERNAVFSMVRDGCRQILAVAIALPGGGPPCGACRQVLAEFGRDYPVYLIDSETGSVAAEWNIEKLIPVAFRPDNLSNPPK